MNTDIKAKVVQADASVLSGDESYIQMSKIGQLWTADWKYKLVAAGRCYRLSFGTISGGTDIVLGGAATGGIDLDRPEGIVAADTGFLIPMEIDISGDSDTDAEDDDVQVLVTADRATAVAAGATATAETPDNLLDGGEAFTGRAWSLATGDITDPVHSDILYYRFTGALGANSLANTRFINHKVWEYPNFIKGPCSLLIYAAGEVAFTFAGSFVFAHIPTSWAPTSD